nr:hypothetical protein 1 [Pelagibacteraceae bacterium]
MTHTTQWCLWDVLNEKSIGIWTDICQAEEFMMDNQEEFEVWSVMPADELITTEV